MDQAQLVQTIEALERRLLDLDVRASESAAELLAVDFVEIGKSGRLYDRDACLAALAQGRVQHTYRLEQFVLRLLASDVVLSTYALTVTAPSPSVSRRSSIWSRDPNGPWRMAFHQGTSAGAAPQPASGASA